MRALVVVCGLALSGGALADDRGYEVFTAVAVPNCGVCHTLAAAGTGGAIGPILDDLKPDAARVKAAVSQGVGVMPAYSETLSEADIDAVAAYVAGAAAGE